MKALLQELRGEHEVILRRLDALEFAIAAGDTSVLAEFLEFFESYIERRHHAKEENALFPQMRQSAHLAEIVENLLDEHHEDRRIVERLRTGGYDRELLSTYIDNVRFHIAKEDTMIFESVEHAFT